MKPAFPYWTGLMMVLSAATAFQHHNYHITAQIRQPALTIPRATSHKGSIRRDAEH